jgi:mono/diheme cytochrome c family protein
MFATAVLTLFVLSGNALAGGDAQAGKAVFESKCKTCHGVDGKGNPDIAKVMKVTLPDMTSEAVHSKTDDEFKKQISEGSGKMKPVKGLTDQQLLDVAAYVRTLGKS